MFAVVLPQGKYRYTVLPQGTSASCDIFNIVTDGGIRGKEGFYKNIDDILTASDSCQKMEERLRILLEICREKNIKLNPEKFQVGHQVQFGGVDLCGRKLPGDKERRVYITPSHTRLEEFFKIETQKCKKDVQRIIGMTNQLKKWIPNVAFKSVNLRKLSSVNVKFMWNNDLSKELEELKGSIKNCVKLSPMDTSKPIHAHVDAAQTEGMAYLLCQPRSENPSDGKTIVSCNSTSFTDAQKRYSPFECETLAAQWLCKSEDYYLRAAQEITVFSDAKGLKGLFESDLGKIENARLQGMVEKMLPYNITFVHIKGTDNGVADFGSRYPRPGSAGDEFPIFRPSVAHRSRRIMEKHFDAKDPQVERIAKIAVEDANYNKMLEHIIQRTAVTKMDETCELRNIEGCLKDLSVYKTDTGKGLILRNCSEILIPEKERENLLEQLHSTHLESDSMKRLARGRFWWPKFSKDIEEKYKSCSDCKTESNSKMHKVEVIPPDLCMLAPSEEISMDYATFGTRKLLIIKDRATGFLDVQETKDQTTQEAMKCVHRWAFTFGLPHSVRTDGGPAFRDGFISYLGGLGINHTPSSAYNPSSNGLAERGVRQIKDVLKKIKKPSKEKLREIVFNVNNHKQKDAGSAAERFFRRGVQTILPNSIVREIDHRALIKARHQRQEKIAKEKGRTSKDSFQEGDKVIVQDPITKRWTLEGEITAKRTANDQSIQSYEVALQEGGVALRNKRFIKHASIQLKKRVRFELDKPVSMNEADKDKRAGPVTRNRARQPAPLNA